MEYNILKHIDSPTDVKNLNDSDIQLLVNEVRNKIINTVSTNGGHLASNLGMVETTIAIYKCFDLEKDKLIFDVGHQCYCHKLLSGRFENFDSLRKFNGISGFTNRFESKYDTLTEGHSGTALSSALGVAESNLLNGNDAYTIAVVGDGSSTNGMVYEALNSCVNKKLNLILILNDNQMSISSNNGGISKHFNKLRTSSRYFRLKRGLEKYISKIPLIGYPIVIGMKNIKDAFKRMISKGNLFEDFGFVYLGPVDGNNIKKMQVVFEQAKRIHKPCIIHMYTKKGKGYSPAEESPSQYHAVGKFDIEKGVENSTNETFSSHFGNELCKKAEIDNKVCAISAAMLDGTGLSNFAKLFPNRTFDVGIAEEHSIAFAGGLSLGGYKPFVALYSTFSQRIFDQIFHDVSIQKLDLTLTLDRCGLVQNDGITHQGIFDIPLFSSIPNIKIYSPENYKDLDYSINESFNEKGIKIIRYPKGQEINVPNIDMIPSNDKTIEYSGNINECNTIIITFGRMASLAKSICKNHKDIGLIKLIKIHPIDINMLIKLTSGANNIYLLEESVKSGGIGEKIASKLCEMGINKKIKIHAIENYQEHGDISNLFFNCGFDEKTIIKNINSLNECNN